MIARYLHAVATLALWCACARRGPAPIPAGEDSTGQGRVPEAAAAALLDATSDDGMVERPRIVSLLRRSRCALSAAREIWCVGDDARFFRGLPIPRAAAVVDVEQLPVTAFFPGGVLTLQGDRTVVLAPHDAQSRTILDGARAMAAGNSDACAILDDSTVSCWELDTSKELVVERIDGVIGATKIAVGGLWGCAIRKNGSVVCWRNLHLRRETPRPPNEPWPISLRGAIVDIAAGNAFGCAIDHGGFVWCWGDNRTRVVTGSSVDEVEAPRRIEGVSRAVAIQAGDGHVCAIDGDGSVFCWGDNTYGEVGADEAQSPAVNRQSRAPRRYAHVTRVPGLAGVIGVSTGSGFSCALERSGEVLCWGAILQRARDVAVKPWWMPIQVTME
jgi:Regulator of chromosome condensation (RCC1) repeat